MTVQLCRKSTLWYGCSSFLGRRYRPGLSAGCDTATDTNSPTADWFPGGRGRRECGGGGGGAPAVGGHLPGSCRSSNKPRWKPGVPDRERSKRIWKKLPNVSLDQSVNKTFRHTKRQKDKKTYRGFDVISHDICNHVILGFWSNTHNLEILWIWCTISQNLSIKQLPIQSTHKSIQSNQSIKTVVQTSASPYSFAVFI